MVKSEIHNCHWEWYRFVFLCWQLAKMGHFLMNQSQNSALSYGPHVCSSFK
jgi:hypothetical protein